MFSRFLHASQIRKSALTVFIALALIASFLGGSLPAAHAESAPALFTDALQAQAPSAETAHTARSRLVNVNLDLLFDSTGKPRDVSALPEVTLNLFPDAQYTGVVDHVSNAALNSTAWSGKLAGVDGGYFYLVATDGALIAHVGSAQGIYEVSSAGDGLYRVIQLDQSQLVDDAPRDYPPPGPVYEPGGLGAAADSGSQIDVMVVYTPAALAGEGSLAALKARIALAMTETNQSYANAGITPRLRLVHIQQVSYAESGSVGTDVERLKNPSDGFIDGVHSLRNTYGADMVALVVESADACGQAYNIMASASEAFDVVLRPDCLTGYYSFGHEFGHLQGAQHDTYVDPTTVVYSYAHGFVYLPDRWRTVMAYDAKCTDTDPFTSCTRLQYWSNNNKTYGGAAMGDTNARNYQALNNTAYTVANFRAQKIAANFSSNFNANHNGWSPVSGSWALASSAYYTSPGLAGKYNSIVHTGTYGDLTYLAKIKRTGCSNCANTIVIRGASSPLDSENGWRTGYWFYYTNTGSFLVLKGVSGSYTLLQDWTGSGAIHTGANWNTLKVVAVGSSLTFYINGTLVWSGTDSSLRTGRVGIEWWRPSSGTGNKLYVDSSSLTTTATADMLPAADVPAPLGGPGAGVGVPGGERPNSP